MTAAARALIVADPRPRPLTVAERSARFHARQRRGLVVVPVEVRETDVVLWLIKEQLLNQEQAGDPKAVAAALSAAIVAITRR